MAIHFVVFSFSQGRLGRLPAGRNNSRGLAYDNLEVVTRLPRQRACTHRHCCVDVGAALRIPRIKVQRQYRNDAVLGRRAAVLPSGAARPWNR